MLEKIAEIERLKKYQIKRKNKMEIEKLSIDGKTTTLKVADKILSAKINKKLVVMFFKN